MGKTKYILDAYVDGAYSTRIRKEGYVQPIRGILPYDEKSEELIIIAPGDTYKETIIYNDGKCGSWYLRNSIITLYVEKSQFPNLVKISYGPGDGIDYSEHLNLFPQNSLFVPATDMKVMVSKKEFKEGYYNFQFNYFIEGDGIFRLVPNQPFVVLEKVDEPDPNTKTLLDYLFR